MDWEILIPILMFLVPFVLSILDKRAKKRKGIPPVKSAPVDTSSPFPFGAEGPGARPVERPAAQDPSQPVGWAPPSHNTEGRAPEKTVFPGVPQAGPVPSERKPDSPAAPVEGVRAIRREEPAADAAAEKPDKLRIDKKKLILYSEILKPKFDA